MKQYKLPKGLKTVDDILASDDVKGVLSDVARDAGANEQDDWAVRVDDN